MANPTPNKYSPQRLPGREHIPAYPRGFIALRIVQLALALMALGLCAFGAYLWPISGNCLMLFVAVATLITTVWLVVAEYSLPRIYNYWAVLALDIFLVVFWLCAFALLASQVAFVFSGSSYCDLYSCYSSEPTGLYFVFAACMAAASALGGLQFALFITSLAIHSTMLHRHRKAGLHCTPHDAGNSHGTVSNEKTAAAQASYQPVNPGAPPYAQQDAAFGNGQQHQTQPQAPQQQQQQQMYNPAAQQQVPPQTQQGQFYPPQQVPTPLSAQHTGGSFVQMNPQQHQHQQPPMPANAHEVAGQQQYRQ
ncbi:hypothetical protein ACHAQA_000420 [Verticillium albo-atrum]